MEKDYSGLSYIQKYDLITTELIKVKHEINISKLVYQYHDSDCYEHLFRDNIKLLQEKYDGIKYALENLKKYK